jgi:CheY-like chemotaxis protein
MAIILVVEDDVFLREIAEMNIQGWGYQTLGASDVPEALSIIRSPQHIDALFTDIYLKAESEGGCDIARQATILRPDLRVLYVTGNSLTERMKALFVAGSNCLGKPYAPGQLQDALEGILAA